MRTELRPEPRTEVPYDSFWDELRKAVRRGGPFEINSRIDNWRPSSLAATTQASFTPVTYTSSARNAIGANTLAESMRALIQTRWDYVSNGAPTTASSAATTFRNGLRRTVMSATTAGMMWTGETIEKKQIRKFVPDDSPFAKCPACGNNVAPDLVYCNTCGKVMPE